MHTLTEYMSARNCGIVNCCAPINMEPQGILFISVDTDAKKWKQVNEYLVEDVNRCCYKQHE